MAEQAVKEYLERLGLGDGWRQYPGSCATVEEAAQQLGTQPGAVGKTICVPDRSGQGRCILIVTAGDQKLDNQKFRQQFAFRPGMLPADQVEDCVGHPPGGVCPFALPEGGAGLPGPLPARLPSGLHRRGEYHQPGETHPRPAGAGFREPGLGGCQPQQMPG